MTKRLDPVEKKKRAKEREDALKQAKAKRCKDLSALIKKHGNANQAAKALGISSQAFYERMDHAGLEREEQSFLLDGEPVDKAAKKKWWKQLLKKYTVPELAKKFGRTATPIRERIQRAGITLAHGVEPAGLKSTADRKKWLEGLLKKHGNGFRVARKLKIKPQAIYERMQNYGIERSKAA